jgi:hypothetical protein
MDYINICSKAILTPNTGRILIDTAAMVKEYFAAYGVSAAIARHDTEHPLA